MFLLKHVSALGEPLSVFFTDFSFRAGSVAATGSFSADASRYTVSPWIQAVIVPV